ncbi:MAG: rhombotarget lipoprotein [Gammaproteobacteria bacterium]|nr:rhombotarget lipoprotein [Gammaproteobacteria bacterium]
MRKVVITVLVSALAALAGCADLLCAPNCHAKHQESSSLVAFLYPGASLPPVTNSIPQLHLPLRVGLSFLPTPGGRGPTAAQRQQLLERVRDHFKDLHFVSQIVVIPDYYLAAQHGFEGLAAVQRLYSLDLIALVSYDQVTNTDSNKWSLGYLTIVGAYVLKGNRYDVSTLVDLAVVDPVTRSLVLRAGGVDTRDGTATAVGAARAERAASASGYDAAANQMITHFDAALADFEAQVKAGRANVRVVNRRDAGNGGGGSGGGALDWLTVSTLLAILMLRGTSPGRRVAWRALDRRLGRRRPTT